MTPEHVCDPVYVTEGEVVCFECGAVYAYHGTYDPTTLAECREIVAARNAGPSDPNEGVQRA